MAPVAARRVTRVRIGFRSVLLRVPFHHQHCSAVRVKVREGLTHDGHMAVGRGTIHPGDPREHPHQGTSYRLCALLEREAGKAGMSLTHVCIEVGSVGHGLKLRVNVRLQVPFDFGLDSGKGKL